MDKMTHTKFNLNSFLMALSVAIDNTIEDNKFNIRYSSKRVSYSALRIINYLEFEPSYFSDIFSYSILYANSITNKSLEIIPFVNKDIYKNKQIKNIIKLAKFIEDNINIKNNVVINKQEIIDLVKQNKDLDEHLKECFEDLSSDITYWLDLISHCQLPFHIYNFLQDFTFECEYESLIELSKVINEVVYNYSSNKNIPNISDKCNLMCDIYNMDNKDKSRMIISSNLYNIGALFIDKDIFLKKDKLTKDEYDAIKSIPYYSAASINQIFGFDDISKICSMYAEKLDGSGYPYELEANTLSLKNRLISILVIYQALLENRSYRSAYSFEESIEILRQEAKDGKIDLTIVEDLNNKFKE